MSTRNSVQKGFDSLGKSANLRKKGGTWYLHSNETIAVINLQKSQYGPQYYINIGLWLKALGDEQYPKEHKCHVRTRIELIFENIGHRITNLLDLEHRMDEKQREDGIDDLLNGHLLPLLSSLSSLDGLRSPTGFAFLDACLVMGQAQDLLTPNASE